MNVLIDTNIITRWVNPKDANHQLAADALRQLRRSGHVPTVVPQNLYEFWVVATRPLDVNGLGMNRESAHAEIRRLSAPLFSLLLDERAILSRWTDLVFDYDVKGKPAHDARLVAAMLRHGLSHVLTFNAKDFRRYTELTVVTPDAVVSGAASFGS